MAALHFPLRCSKFHCCNFDTKSSALFFGSSRSLMRSLSSPSVILWLEESVLGRLSASLEADGCCSSLFEETLSSSSEYIAKLSGGSGRGRPSPWGTGRIADGLFGYTIVCFFLHGQAILNRGHHTGITVSTLVARHPPNHWHSKRHTTYFSTDLLIAFVWTRGSAHVWCPFFVLVPYRTVEIKETCLFYCWSNRTIPWGKWHFSANITEAIRVIYALLGHFDKHTAQYMTVECQLTLSQHNSHERTWGYHLQYDRFRTTLNKNWRELPGNNFIHHVTNTCSDESRSCDFIVVWELRRKTL